MMVSTTRIYHSPFKYYCFKKVQHSFSLRPRDRVIEKIYVPKKEDSNNPNYHRLYVNGKFIAEWIGDSNFICGTRKGYSILTNYGEEQVVMKNK